MITPWYPQRLPVHKVTKSTTVHRMMSSPILPKRVLVIDDNYDAADLIAELLQIHGHDAVTAYSGMDGLNKAFSFAPHLVLLDLGMPGMDGFAVAASLRGNTAYPQPYLVAYTAWNDVATKDRVRASGFDRHMTKPANFQEIVELVQQLPYH